MLTKTLAKLAKGYPVLLIAGPRQAGKTTLARTSFGHLPYVSLEDPLEQAAFAADPRAWLRRYPDGAVLDEIQRTPSLPRWLPGVVDADRRMGRWIITGSQQYQAMDKVTQSLAGRVARLELMPFCHRELAVRRAPCLKLSTDCPSVIPGLPYVFGLAITQQITRQDLSQVA